MKLIKNSHIYYSVWFFSIAILFSWPFFFISDIWLYPLLIEQGNMETAVLVLLGGHVCAMFGPAFSGYICSKYFTKTALPDWKWGRIDFYWKSTLLMGAVWLIPAAAGFIFSDFSFINSFNRFHWIYILTYLSTVFFASAGEEAGWCGFLLPFLSPALGRTTSIVISGIYRGIWHLPVLAAPFISKTIYGDGSLILLIPICLALLIQLVISNILFGAFFSYFWYKTGSIPLLGYMHFLFNMLRDFVAIMIAGFSSSYIGKIGWAFLFYYFAYSYLKRISEEDGIKNLKKFIFNKNFGEIERAIK